MAKTLLSPSWIGFGVVLYWIPVWVLWVLVTAAMLLVRARPTRRVAPAGERTPPRKEGART